MRTRTLEEAPEQQLLCDQFVHGVEKEDGSLERIEFHNEDKFNFAFVPCSSVVPMMRISWVIWPRARGSGADGRMAGDPDGDGISGHAGPRDRRAEMDAAAANGKRRGRLYDEDAGRRLCARRMGVAEQAV